MSSIRVPSISKSRSKSRSKSNNVRISPFQTDDDWFKLKHTIDRENIIKKKWADRIIQLLPIKKKDTKKILLEEAKKDDEVHFAKQVLREFQNRIQLYLDAAKFGEQRIRIQERNQINQEIERIMHETGLDRNSAIDMFVIHKTADEAIEANAYDVIDILERRRAFGIKKSRKHKSRKHKSRKHKFCKHKSNRSGKRSRRLRRKSLKNSH